MTTRTAWELRIRIGILGAIGLLIAWASFYMTAEVREALAIACDAAGPPRCPNVSVDIIALRCIGGLFGMSFPILMSAFLEWCDDAFD